MKKQCDLAAQKAYFCNLVSPKLFEMAQFGKNKSFLNFCYEYNGFCLKYQTSLFPKLETCDFRRKIFKIANFRENISDPIDIFFDKFCLADTHKPLQNEYEI